MSRADKITSLSKSNQLYSDFLNNLNPHPVAKDIVRYVNENAVTKAIMNLVLTNRGERLYQPDIGSDIRALLFEPMSSATGELLSTYIRETIDNYEPRAKVLSVDVEPNYDGNAYNVTVAYFIINRLEPVIAQITLDRVR